MKRYALTLLILAMVCIAACSKKKGAAPAPAPTGFVDSPYLSMYVDSSFHFATDSATLSTISYPSDSGRADIKITAVRSIGGIGYTVSFYISNFTGINAYVIAPPAVSATYYVGGVRHYAQSGQIVIATDTNNVITGSFNFVADSLVVTKGAFNVQQ